MTDLNDMIGRRVRHLTRRWVGRVSAIVGPPLVQSLDPKVIVEIDRLGARPVPREAYASDLEILPAPATINNTGCGVASGALFATMDDSFPPWGAVHQAPAPSVIPLPPPARRPGLRLAWSRERGRV